MRIKLRGPVGELVLMSIFCILVTVTAIIIRHPRVIFIAILAALMVLITLLGQMRHRRTIRTINAKGRRKRSTNR